jgi:hypothetical protein
MNLKSKILEYINQNAEGVRISDMEKPLGENRMKIGYVTKGLLEEEKIKKIEDRYFPVFDERYNDLKLYRKYNF